MMQMPVNVIDFSLLWHIHIMKISTFLQPCVIEGCYKLKKQHGFTVLSTLLQPLSQGCKHLVSNLKIGGIWN